MTRIATILSTLALLLFGGAAHAQTSCWTHVHSCPADTSWNDNWSDDDYGGAGGSQAICSGRPAIWHSNCGDASPGTSVTTYFYSDPQFDIQAQFEYPPAGDTTPPSQVSGLSTTVASSTEIDLSWTAATDNVGVTGYKVYRGGTLLTTLGNVTTFANTGLSPSTTYSYTVSALDAAGNEGTQSAASSKTTSAATTTETMGLTTVPSGTDGGNGNMLLAQQATLAAPGSLTSISFYVKTAGGNLRLGVYDNTGTGGKPGALIAQTGSFTPVVGWNTQPITSGTLAAGTYWLAYNPSSSTLGFPFVGSGTVWWRSFTFAALPSTFGTTSGGSTATNWSIYATLNTSGGGGGDTTAPSQVSGLSATAASSSQINLAWSAATDNVAVTGYKIYRAGALVHTNGNTLTYSDTGLTASTSYSYQVSAIDAAGNEGTKSTAASATTQAATSVGPTGPVGPVATTCTGTNIAAGANIQTAVNAAGTNTTFCLAAGTYTSQSVVPKVGDKFIGAQGAIMDGGGNTQRAFSGGANTVTVQNILIRNYTAGQQIAPVSPGAGTGWQIIHNEITANPGAGVEIGVGMLVQFNFIHHNLEEGYACGNCDPTIATGIVIDSNEISFNNYTDAYDPGFEAGGGKLWQTNGAQVTHNYSHDNHGPGLWDDFQNDNIVYAFNRVENNTNGGIFHEIGYNASIHDNSISNNATSTNTNSLCVWLWCPSIGVAASGGHNGGQVEIFNNTIVVSGSNGSGSTGVGIGLIQQARGNGTDGLPWLVQHVHVHDNTTTMTAAGSHQGAAEDNGDTAIFTSRDNTFVHNTYNLGTNNDAFWWNNADGGKTFWQGFGLDTTGTFN